MTTTERDPVPGVNSFNTEISQNYFDNVFQIITTSNHTLHGGSAMLLVTISGNSITNLTGTAPALTLLKSTFPGLTVTSNQFSNIPAKTISISH